MRTDVAAIDFDAAYVSAETLAQVHQLYARQCHCIDSGFAAQWAATFTEDGVFASPSYPEPVRGTVALEQFVSGFLADSAAHGQVRRHVVDNLAVFPTGDDQLTVRAYISITATGDRSVQILRVTTATDELVRDRGGWRIARRVIARDDQA